MTSVSELLHDDSTLTFCASFAASSPKVQ